VITVALAVA